jgi:recombination protein RecT
MKSMIKSEQNTLADLLDKCRPEIDKVIPKHLTSERLTRLALSVCSRNETLSRCSSASILRAVMDAAKLGLEPTGAAGGAHLVAYRNSRTGQYEAQLITDYRGEMELVRRSGLVSSITCHVVHELDSFELFYGDEERLIHRPSMTSDRGRAIGVYAIAHLHDGQKQRIYLSGQEVEHYRSKSRSADSGPWVTDTLAMWRKTAIRRLCNMLPRHAELSEHAEREEQIEYEYGEHAQAEVESAQVEQREQPKALDDGLSEARARYASALASLESAVGKVKATALASEYVKSLRGTKTKEHVLERVAQIERLAALAIVEREAQKAWAGIASKVGEEEGGRRVEGLSVYASTILGDEVYSTPIDRAQAGLAELIELDASIEAREPGEDG